MTVHHAPVMLDILEEHFEEVDFLWGLREGVIFAPHWFLPDLAELEDRVEAHLDGLRIGAEHSLAVARPALVGEKKGAATAATLVFMSMDDPTLENEVVSAFAVAPPEACDGIRIGLRHCRISRIAASISQIASSGSLALRALATDILAFQRLPPPPRFAELLNHRDPAIRDLVFGAAGRFGGPWGVDYLEDSLNTDPTHLQRIALETSAKLGIPDLPVVCRKAATKHQNPSAEALSFLGIVGDAQDLPLLRAALQKPDLARAALGGLGALGNTGAVPLMIGAMRDPTLAHAAGAAFLRISGADGGKIQADQPLPPPTGLPEDEAAFWDDTKPPDPARAQAWWDLEQRRFAPEQRWQAGQEISLSTTDPHFNDLPLQVRRDIYLGARARDPVRVPDSELEQRAILQGWRLFDQT